jgi:hypothetical protein
MECGSDVLRLTWKGAVQARSIDGVLLTNMGMASGAKVYVATTNQDPEDDTVDLVLFPDVPRSGLPASSTSGWGGSASSPATPQTHAAAANVSAAIEAGLSTPPRPTATGTSASPLIQRTSPSSAPRKLSDLSGTPLPRTAKGLMIAAMNRSPGRTPPALNSGGSVRPFSFGGTQRQGSAGDVLDDSQLSTPVNPDGTPLRPFIRHNKSDPGLRSALSLEEEARLATAGSRTHSIAGSVGSGRDLRLFPSRLLANNAEQFDRLLLLLKLPPPLSAKVWSVVSTLPPNRRLLHELQAMKVRFRVASLARRFYPHCAHGCWTVVQQSLTQGSVAQSQSAMWSGLLGVVADYRMLYSLVLLERVVTGAHGKSHRDGEDEPDREASPPPSQTRKRSQSPSVGRGRPGEAVFVQPPVAAAWCMRFAQLGGAAALVHILGSLDPAATSELRHPDVDIACCAMRVLSLVLQFVPTVPRPSLKSQSSAESSAATVEPGATPTSTLVAHCAPSVQAARRIISPFTSATTVPTASLDAAAAEVAWRDNVLVNACQLMLACYRRDSRYATHSLSVFCVPPVVSCVHNPRAVLVWFCCSLVMGSQGLQDPALVSLLFSLLQDKSACVRGVSGALAHALVSISDSPAPYDIVTPALDARAVEPCPSASLLLLDQLLPFVDGLAPVTPGSGSELPATGADVHAVGSDAARGPAPNTRFEDVFRLLCRLSWRASVSGCARQLGSLLQCVIALLRRRGVVEQSFEGLSGSAASPVEALLDPGLTITGGAGLELLLQFTQGNVFDAFLDAPGAEYSAIAWASDDAIVGAAQPAATAAAATDSADAGGAALRAVTTQCDGLLVGALVLLRVLLRGDSQWPPSTAASALPPSLSTCIHPAALHVQALAVSLPAVLLESCILGDVGANKCLTQQSRSAAYGLLFELVTFSARSVIAHSVVLALDTDRSVSSGIVQGLSTLSGPPVEVVATRALRVMLRSFRTHLQSIINANSKVGVRVCRALCVCLYVIVLLCFVV